MYNLCNKTFLISRFCLFYFIQYSLTKIIRILLCRLSLTGLQRKMLLRQKRCFSFDDIISLTAKASYPRYNDMQKILGIHAEKENWDWNGEEIFARKKHKTYLWIQVQNIYFLYLSFWMWFFLRYLLPLCFTLIVLHEFERQQFFKQEEVQFTDWRRQVRM